MEDLTPYLQQGAASRSSASHALPAATLPTTYRHFPQDYQPQGDDTHSSSSPYRRYPEDYQPQLEGRPSSSSPPAEDYRQSSNIQAASGMGPTRIAKRMRTDSFASEQTLLQPPERATMRLSEALSPAQQQRMQAPERSTMSLSEALSPTQQTRMQRQQHPTMRFPDSLRRLPEPMPHTTQQLGPTMQHQQHGQVSQRVFEQQQQIRSSLPAQQHGQEFQRVREQQQQIPSHLPAPVVPQMQSSSSPFAASRSSTTPGYASARPQAVENYDPMWHTLSPPVAADKPMVAFRSEAWSSPMALSPVWMAGMPFGGTVEVANHYNRTGSARKGGHTQSGNGRLGGTGRS